MAELSSEVNLAVAEELVDSVDTRSAVHTKTLLLVIDICSKIEDRCIGSLII